MMELASAIEIRFIGNSIGLETELLFTLNVAQSRSKDLPRP